MADASESAEKKAKKPKKPKKKLIFMIAPALVVVIAGVFILGPGASLIGLKKEDPKGKAEKHEELSETIVDLGEFVINLTVPKGEDPRYAKISVAIALKSPASEEYVTARVPFFRDVIIERFASSSVEELSTVQGRQNIRNQLTSEFLRMMPEGETIEKILITNLAFQ